MAQGMTRNDLESLGWGDLILAYRHLSYDMGSDELLQNTDFSGPALGVVFRF